MKGESSGGEKKGKKIHQKDTEKDGRRGGEERKVREGGEGELEKGRKSIMGSM